MSAVQIPKRLRGPAVALLALAAFSILAWLVFGSRLSGGKTRVAVNTQDLREEYEALMRGRSREALANVEPILRNGVAWPGLAITKEAKAKWLGHFANSVKIHKTPDPDAYYILNPHQVVDWRFPEHPRKVWKRHTNSLGMRGLLEPSEESPDLRVIVVGDSHIEGVCRDRETYPAWLRRLLLADYPGRTIESFNAGVGGYDAYNYLGVLEKFIELKPDIFVMTVYGGNDFKGGLVLRNYYTGTKGPRAVGKLKQRILESGVDLIGLNPQEIEQAAYFMSFPGQARRSVEMMVAITDRMESLCLQNGIQLFCVYLPPPMRAQPQYYREEIAKIETALPEFADPLGSSDQIADAWLEFVDEREIEKLDLRPIFAAAEEPLYWVSDRHINLAGQRLIAESIRPRIERVLRDKIGATEDGEGQDQASDSGD